MMKKIIFTSTVIFALLFSACTKDFEEINTNPYEISSESLEQDFNHLGSYFKSLYQGSWSWSSWGLFGDQVAHNLTNVSFVRHLATPTPFVGGVNNTTYYITWNGYWGQIYSHIMAPSRLVRITAQETGYDVFDKWGNLVQILGTSRLSAYVGPVIYSDFGSSEQEIMYDSEQTLYNTWFAELDDILQVFSDNVDYIGLAKFDDTYGGDMTMWIKFINSVRLRLAMRLTNIDGSLAQTQAEKAMSDPGGLITSNAENMMLDLYGQQFHPALICYGWDDTRMSATMESVLIGYEDNRVGSYFEPVDASLVPDHPDWPYKGIRNGAELAVKSDRTDYSYIHKDFNNPSVFTKRRLFTASETHFLLAEAALRGWATGGTAEGHYEDGVKASFEEWGAGGADAYLLNDTGLPLDYDDPRADGDVNDFISRITITVKWDDAASNEVKLERIMTQKWIAAHHNTVEIWVDHRRTDYPKLPFNYQNSSNADWGIIPADGFLRRMPFDTGEKTNNPVGYADGVSKLGGPDEIGTRLWWDTGGPNF